MHSPLLIDEQGSIRLHGGIFLPVGLVTACGNPGRSGQLVRGWPGSATATTRRAPRHLGPMPPTGAFPAYGTSPHATDGTVGGSAPPHAGGVGGGGERT